MDDKRVDEYLGKVQEAISEANKESPSDFNRFNAILVEETEAILKDLDEEIKREGVRYGSPHESRATARALLWAGWISWVWPMKADHREPPDQAAKNARPIAEKLLQQFIGYGKKTGEAGQTPDNLHPAKTNQSETS